MTSRDRQSTRHDMKIVISEFMDAPAVRALAAEFDVVYDKSHDS